MTSVSSATATSQPVRLAPVPAVLPPASENGWRHLGCTSSSHVTQEDVTEQLAALANMGRSELLSLWRRLYRSAPPDRISRDLLQLGIAWKLQEKVFGGLKKAITSELRRLASDLLETGDIRRAEEPLLKPGTRLLREWGGVTHEVTVLDDGFLWQDKTWTSLSAIAEKITGAHWSGPRFFGLKKRPSLSVAPKDSEGTSSTSQVTPMASDLREEPADA